MSWPNPHNSLRSIKQTCPVLHSLLYLPVHRFRCRRSRSSKFFECASWKTAVFPNRSGCGSAHKTRYCLCSSRSSPLVKQWFRLVVHVDIYRLVSKHVCCPCFDRTKDTARPGRLFVFLCNNSASRVCSWWNSNIDLSKLIHDEELTVTLLSRSCGLLKNLMSGGYDQIITGGNRPLFNLFSWLDLLLDAVMRKGWAHHSDRDGFYVGCSRF